MVSEANIIFLVLVATGGNLLGIHFRARDRSVLTNQSYVAHVAGEAFCYGVSSWELSAATKDSSRVERAAKVYSATDGYEVDLQSGLFVHKETDLSFEGVVPIQLIRTYCQSDPISRPFGIGTSHPYELFLVGDTSAYSYLDLILPDGGGVHYRRVSPGRSYADGVFEHTTSQSPFKNSRIIWNGHGWNLTLADGALYLLPDGYNSTRAAQCAMVGYRDGKGNALTLVRDSASNLLSITSPSGRWVRLTYDSGNRIVQAKGSDGKELTYQYDTAGRLIRVRDSKAKVTDYTYDASHQMLAISEGGRVLVTNEYDRAGRVSRQILKDGRIFKFSYVSDSKGNITETAVTEPTGKVNRFHFTSEP